MSTSSASGRPSDFPPGQWVKLLATQADLEAHPEYKGKRGIRFEDGWVDATAANPTPSFRVPGLIGKNQGVRLRGRTPPNLSKPANFTIFLRIGSGAAEDRVAYQLSLGGLDAVPYLWIRHYKSLKKGEDLLASVKMEQPPKPGEEFLMEFYAIGDWLVGRINGKDLSWAKDPRLESGEVYFQSSHLIRDVEAINFDGLSEAEALKLAGVEGMESAMSPGATSLPVSSIPVPGRLHSAAIDGRAPPSWLSEAIESDRSDNLALAAFSNPSTAVNGVSEDLLLVIRADGTVKAFIPPDHALREPGVDEWCDQIRGAKSVVATAAGVAVLLEDGSIVTKGMPNWSVPAEVALQGPFTRIAGGHQHVIALRADGTVLGWGDNRSGQITPPPGLKGVRRIACGHLFSVAWEPDGRVTTWGLSGMGQILAPDEATGDNLGIAATRNGVHSLKSGGKLVNWGWRSSGGSWPILTLPTDAEEIVAGTGELAIRSADGDWKMWTGIAETFASAVDLGGALKGCRNPVFVGGQVVAIRPGS